MIQLAHERPEHRGDIAALLRSTFGGNDEAALVARLHDDGLTVLSLIALEGAEVVGHVLFSQINVTIDGHALSTVALAPVAVAPSRQRQGIGSLMIRQELDELKQTDVVAVIVLGHPGYYPRFGFSAALARKLEAPIEGDAFMALELRPNALAGLTGVARYPKAWRIG